MSTRDTSEINDTTEVTQTQAAFEDHSSLTAAFEKHIDEIKAVDDESLAALNLDVPSAVATVLGSLPEIAAYRQAMSALPGLDQTKIQDLEDYTLAAAEAHARWVTAMRPPPDILALNAQALTMRELLRSDATALAHRNLVAPEQVDAFKGYVGYKNVAFELIEWANLMRDNWNNIQGKTALTEQEVQNAKDVGERLLRAAGLREQAPALQAEAAHLRQQAVTLFLAAYDETRRAIGYLRWHENDADTIAPSLYAGKTRQPTDATPPEPAPSPQPPASPAPPPVVTTPATPPHGGTNGATNGLAAVAQGLPGASPYGA
jgi:hypothetical protein